MILSGSPNREKSRLMRAVATPSAVIVLLHGSRITPFIRPWLTTTRIESKSDDLGRSVIRSIDIWENGQIDFGPGIGSTVGFIGCQFILNCWHSGQP